ncbi:choice-of-anchor Q domain-containing protein [Pseudoalteromonas tunicata]|jgi:hypothetical protein|uniref:OmpA-like transmembrane domain protein n=1 Tax=Pseudoalteromonas tunicata D2 TaxID=87626 RepID=A4C3N6_9GAMM|nr:choice-of-anchor Q domain-containing protein [Pseudoalteromonas tunicata]ATC96552.1 hypothetical protein PTUN_b0092 [Pseudoalteromonas tunicata]AXT33411.1 cell envelope biogenesis protein OmpA [Pseudoalteromonas tunicata]EAR30168.1 OmpA-like transmembrane domain protein [Pseudoalteromonas tunicata D2]
MNRIILICCFSLLTACGGGSDSTPDLPPQPSPPPTDPLSQYINVKEAYTGNASPAALNNATLGQVYVYIALLAPELLPDYNDDPGSVGASCSGGGSLNITNGSSDNEKYVSFDNCSEDGMVTNGKATVRANKFSANGELIDSTIIFENIQVKSLLDTDLISERVLSGTSQFKELGEDCSKTEEIHNLLFTDPQTKHQLLYSDFKTHRVGSPNGLCSNNNNSFYVKGDIFDSDLGYWQVRTTKLFMLKTLGSAFEEQGSLTIKGANDSSSTLAVEFYSEQRGNLTSNYPYYRIALLNAANTTTTQTEYIFLQEYFNASMLFDFADDDGDGMTNGWEVAFGFNPLDATDAALDFDGDGYSNLDEYHYWGHPTNIKILPKIADISISLTHEPKNYGATIEVDALISSNADSSQTAIVDVTYTTQAPTQFDSKTYQSHRLCTVSEDLLQLSCQINHLKPGNYQNHKVYLTADKNNTSAVTSSLLAKVAYLGHDFDTTNDNATIEIARLPIDAQFGFSVPHDQLNIIMLVGEQEEAEFSFIQKETASGTIDPLNHFKVQLQLPEFATLLSAQCYEQTTYTWYNCLEKNQLIFTDNGGYRNAYNKFKLTISGHTQGQGHISFTAKSDSTNEQAIGFATFPLVVGQPTQVIQQQIDTAPNMSTITVPNGIYLGPLDLSNKQIQLQAQSQNATLYFNGADYPLFNEATIKLGQSSQLIGFTLASHYITVDEGHSQINNNLFDGTQYHLPSTTIMNNSTLTLAQNRFVGSALDTGYLYDYIREQYHCPYIETGTYYKDENATTINAINNVYSGNLLTHPDIYFACDFIRAYPEAKITMNNNTFQGIGRVLELVYRSGVTPHYEVNMTNNIISNSRFIIENGSYGSTLKDFSAASTFNLINNLIFEVETPFFNMLNKQKETGSVLADPLINYLGYQQANSPSIDTGADITLSIDINGTERPLDGDNNGSKLIDIGAIEFQIN